MRRVVPDGDWARYETLLQHHPPATLWYFGIDDFRKSHPEYCERYELECSFSARLAELVIGGQFVAEGRLNGSLQWAVIDPRHWGQVRVSPAEEAVFLGIQRYDAVRLRATRPPSVHEKMVTCIRAFLEDRSPEDTAQEDVFEHVKARLGPVISRPAFNAAWKGSGLDPSWHAGGRRKAKARRKSEQT